MMNLQCPECHTESLAPTEAFWACSSCRMATTTQALKFQHNRAPLRIASSRNGTSGYFDEPMKSRSTP